MKRILGVLIAFGLFQSAQAGLVCSEEHDGIAYFAFGSPNKIERFDLTADSWMAAIPLESPPTAMTVDDTGIYLAFGANVFRTRLDGSDATPLCTTGYSVHGLHAGGTYLFSVYSSGLYARVKSVNKSTGVVADDMSSYVHSLNGSSFAPSLGKLFGRTQGISPSDIVQVVASADGTLSGSQDSPYHGDYASASRTWVFPDDSKVVDDSGTVYRTSDLTYAGSFGQHVDAIAFSGNSPLIANNGVIFACTESFLEIGRFIPVNRPVVLFVRGAHVYAFSTGGLHGVALEKIALADFTPRPTLPVIDPESVDYVADHIEQGVGDIFYILSKKHGNVFRWSLSSRSYGPSIPLTGTPSYMTYSAELDRLYVAYSSGKITKIDVGSGSIVEDGFVNSPQTPRGLAAAGKHLFVCDPSGAWVSHFTYNEHGGLVDQQDWNHYSHEYKWSARNKKMYFFRDDTSPNDLLWEDISDDGKIGAKQDSPYHSSTGITHPIRVKPDGSTVLLGSGRQYDAIGLTVLNALPHAISDAVWKSGQLFTLSPDGGNSLFKQWTPAFSDSTSFFFNGSPMRCFDVSVGFVLVVNQAGDTKFIVPSGELESLSLQIDSDPPNVGSSFPLDYGAYLVHAGTVVTSSVPVEVDGGGIRYRCAGWRATGCDPATGSTHEFIATISLNSTLTWRWDPVQYWLNAEIVGDGAVNASNGWRNAGVDLELVATPDFGGRFIRWVGDVPASMASSSSITLKMDQPRNIRAVFASFDGGDGSLSGDWPMYGNGPAHAGYFPGVVSSGVITQKWARSFANANPVAVGEGRVYITPEVRFGDAFIYAVDEASGTNLWRHAFGSSYAVHPPSYDSRNVYVQQSIGSGSPTWLCSFNASTGVMNWRSSTSAQWEHYYSPTIADGGIWVNGGTYGGLYGFDQPTGSQRFFYGGLEQYDEWAPAYCEGVLYSWVEGNFRAHHPLTGAPIWSIDLGWNWSGWTMDRAIAVADGFGFVVGNPNLYAVDLTDRHREWVVSGSFQRTPVVADGIVYAISGSNVHAYDAVTGTRLYTYSASASLGYNMVVCDNALFASSGSQTYVFDLWRQTPRQQLPVGGHLALANDALLVAGGSGVYSFDLTSGFVSHTLNVEGAPLRLKTPEPDYGSYPVVDGAPLSLKIDPTPMTNGQTRYVFAGWTGTGSAAGGGTNHLVDFTATANTTVTWIWRLEHWLELVAGHGEITGAVSGWKPQGFVYDLYPSNAVGYVFNHWLTNGVDAGHAVPLSVTLSAPIQVEAVFGPAFIDVTDITRSEIVNWTLNRQTGTYMATLSVSNPSDSAKILTEPFWFVLKPSPYARLMHPDGVEPVSGWPYADITVRVNEAIGLVGDGDTALDPGESVLVRGIEVFSYDRSIPIGYVYGIWADPPESYGINVNLDTDGDGIPNLWEDQFANLSPNNPYDAHGDDDGDGVGNFNEYISDTDPTDAESVMRIRGIQSAPDGIQLRWTGGVQAKQIIEFSRDLKVWHPCHTNQPPTGITNSVQFPGAESALFFRIRVEGR